MYKQRSHDLTSFYYFLWGYVKERVSAMPFENMVELQERIEQVCQSIGPEMLEHVRRLFINKLETCEQRERSVTLKTTCVLLENNHWFQMFCLCDSDNDVSKKKSKLGFMAFWKLNFESRSKRIIYVGVPIRKG